MEIKIVISPIKKAEIAGIAKNQFGDLVKAVVDVEMEIMAIGGELHADEEAIMIAQGSRQENLWGINFYPDKPESEWIEFDSMINVRPSQGNSSRNVESQAAKETIKAVIKKLVF